MLNYSSRKNRRKKLFLLFVPILLSLAGIGIIMLSAIGMLKADEFTWKGFSGIKKLEKKLPDTNFILSLDELPAGDNSHDSQDTSGSEDPIINDPVNIERPSAGGEMRDHILKETLAADEKYFENTLFIGDSRMLGLGMSCQNLGATFYAAVGLSINQLNTKKVINVDSETSYTVMEAVENSDKDFKRIYLMFGLNELGWAYPSVFVRSIGSAIERLTELCPEAEICIMAIMPISADKSVSIYTGHEANARIREYNALLLQLASEMNCWYLDSYNLLADEEGNLPGGFAADGIHMYSEQNKKLMNYIACHAFAS